jgi:hypothetical protein
MNEIVQKREDEYKTYQFVKDDSFNFFNENFNENVKKIIEKLNDVKYSNYMEKHDENIKLQKVGPEYKNYILLNDEYKKLLEFYEKYVTYSLNKNAYIISKINVKSNKSIECLIPSNIKWFNHYNTFQYVLFNLDSTKTISGLATM